MKLFVGGQSADSLSARAAVEACLGLPELAGRVSLQVVDVEAEPRRALEDNVVATPMVVISRGNRSVRLIGDMSRGDQLQELLRLTGSGGNG